MLSMDTYMRGMGGCRLGRMATCMAACGAKATVKYCVRNVLCISGFTPPLLAYAKAAKSRINHALSINVYYLQQRLLGILCLTDAAAYRDNV